ncbi:MAG: metallophosphoesterase [Thermoprotei archaeon]|nr:MAG: metallophosphoesterase [Thermoprotei archaeon]
MVNAMTYKLLGLISDTHDNLKAVDKALEIFKKYNVELILHAGDWIAPFTLKRLAQAGIKIVGVFGNNDGEKRLLLEFAKKFNVDLKGEIAAININGRNIALTHGTSKIIVEALARSNMFDAVIFGHTHKKELKKVSKTLLINPGEACGYLSGEATVAILNVETMDIKFLTLNV